MEKILLLSSKRETEGLVKDSIDQRVRVAIIRDIQEAVADEAISLILVDCDYHCSLDKCLKRFLFVYQQRSIPAAILKPVIIQKSSILSRFFVKILTDANPKNTGEDILSLFKRSPYYISSIKSPLLPFDPLKKIIEAQKRIIESPLEARRLQDLARMAGCSPTWLSLNFKKISGMPLSQFRIRAVVCQALWQLVSTDQPVKTIAFEAGYAPLYLSQVFHKIFKKSPSEARNLLLAISEETRNPVSW
ncbi:MAG: AraC family transcriptional regulator [Candidatus Saccharicenans sp.]|nr:AraC family transcriptional regulator [Candidatus Saccharicenans sp.]